MKLIRRLNVAFVSIVIDELHVLHDDVAFRGERRELLFDQIGDLTRRARVGHRVVVGGVLPVSAETVHFSVRDVDDAAGALSNNGYVANQALHRKRHQDRAALIGHKCWRTTARTSLILRGVEREALVQTCVSGIIGEEAATQQVLCGRLRLIRSLRGKRRRRLGIGRLGHRWQICEIRHDVGVPGPRINGRHDVIIVDRRLNVLVGGDSVLLGELTLRQALQLRIRMRIPEGLLHEGRWRVRTRVLQALQRAW